jgi:hypothetical protein
MIIELARSRIEYDPHATRQAYARRATGSPEECGCIECRNFAAARHEIYSEQVLKLFAQIGISADREAEIYYGAHLASGLHSYGGWFHFVGRILDGTGNESVANVPNFGLEFVRLSEHLQIAVNSHVALVPSAFQDLPLVQLEFLAEAPWILSEPFAG